MMSPEIPERETCYETQLRRNRHTAHSWHPYEIAADRRAENGE